MPERVGRRVIVHGRVQGVGYRVFVQRSAAELGVEGSARNLPDGTVECLLFGSAGAVDALTERLREGPAMARVERLDIGPLPAPEAGGGPGSG